MLNGMMKDYEMELGKISFRRPIASILRNLDGERYNDDKDIKYGLLEHLVHPVKFYQSIEKIDDKIECIEIGSRESVKKFVD
jgi:malonyl CoA-acyl carrier protein transacylase